MYSPVACSFEEARQPIMVVPFEQNLQTMLGARTLTLYTKTGHLFVMAVRAWTGAARAGGRWRRTGRTARASDPGVVLDSDDRK
jgi:hypothetical protein